MTDEAKDLNLGKKIRDIRLKRGLTLQELSDLTGLSKASLSQIENNVTVPPIATLLKISRALGKHIADFFQDEAPASERISVVRAEERKEIMSHMQMEARRIGYRYESLAYHLPDKKMEPFMVEVEPRDEDASIFYKHKGEEFLFVMEGELEFRGAGRVIILKPGDSLYFDSEIPHALRGLRGKKVRALAVIYSP
ncbi:MAG: Cro/Cl family transcriptional regulator [Deltaproteobacteria bacterium]|nr:MAG: Cro/Cl family transcriptional regulator [Deltaproteobacteria bacterium]